ncbi:MAG: FAD-dependent pyridine nucleotide-disulfide oxidoreductase [Myxococcaceae bacterium]|nr:FAD-dependent pyridine nucleotide-disulfide oxidoreductase [Myxococcaceae bacterium]
MGIEAVDVVVVGGGPAGLSAALVLARSCRRVMVYDEGRPRNRVSRAVHNFLSRDGTPPAELREASHRQLAAYPNARLVSARIVDAQRDESGFTVVASDGSRVRCRKLVLATGLVEQLPPVPGMAELYGRGVYSCPYCDGWEVRGSRIAVYGRGDGAGGALALELTGWSSDVVLCTDGPSELSDECSAALARNHVRVRQQRVARLDADTGTLDSVVFEEGAPLSVRALFVCAARREASDLAQRLGSEAYSPHEIDVGRHGRVDIPGLYVIGDAARDVLQVAVAAGEGCEAAIAINSELLHEDQR